MKVYVVVNIGCAKTSIFKTKEEAVEFLVKNHKYDKNVNGGDDSIQQFVNGEIDVEIGGGACSDSCFQLFIMASEFNDGINVEGCQTPPFEPPPLVRSRAVVYPVAATLGVNGWENKSF